MKTQILIFMLCCLFTEVNTATAKNIKGYPEFTMFEELPSWSFYVRHVKEIQMNGIKLHLKADDFRPAFVFDRTSGLRLTDICFPDYLKNRQVI